MYKIFQAAFRATVMELSATYLPGFRFVTARELGRKSRLRNFVIESGMCGLVRESRSDLHFLVVFRPVPTREEFDWAVGWNTEATVPDVNIWSAVPPFSNHRLSIDADVQFARPWFLMDEKKLNIPNADTILDFNFYSHDLQKPPGIDLERAGDEKYMAWLDQENRKYRQQLQLAMMEPIDEASATRRVRPVIEDCLQLLVKFVLPVFDAKEAKRTTE